MHDTYPNWHIGFNAFQPVHSVQKLTVDRTISTIAITINITEVTIYLLLFFGIGNTSYCIPIILNDSANIQDTNAKSPKTIMI